ncbi:Ig-like domain-containing protein [Frondihabitans australicus]|uniref:Bacterial Ig domain-containing protein n=1 Tax=Frondihabitans australicus TaxID=386892 RepID=A0A495IJZ4_9MICO|nr:Ig-like domain-containing protein [Frondihabitans australicus]RKR75738.1 hypothetical protein C8E83_2892 [Frondihabitans australicus]
MKFGIPLRILSTATVVAGLVVVGSCAAEAAPAPQVSTVSSPASISALAVTTPAAVPDGVLLSITGTGQPGATVTARLLGYSATGSATVAADGTWEIPLGLVLSGGTYLSVNQNTAPGTPGNVSSSVSTYVYAS